MTEEGRYYFQLKLVHGHLLKIGVSRKEIEPEQAFCDTPKGWALYNGELRHNSNSNGQKYGAKLETGDVVGVLVDMVEGTLSFMKNGRYMGVAFKDDQLK
eukprot:CAMPEP_0202959408 /NCGR_PEP_ID=MMETSP1396-20130829/3596_1 /ASSEMBLY_ACC=CAM_ASM_000872 /TAXON_ID= /ORGANISM="Pseudokeronopsis sp., Strain Brazil" /LENGTH=99 /DNA_ID=CAMNT_0049677945 /DNA_START=183 /DNA_END=482 /DNA_ORIENTATION=+